MAFYSSQVFFFDQKIMLKRKKRRRKHPDELPRSLRFANLNPRLAAFLSSQERQKNKKALEGEGGEEGQDAEDDRGADGLLKHGHARRGSLDSLDEGEYSQRQMYHEAVVAAPTLLVQLTKILYLFENEQLDLPRELVNYLQSSYRDLTAEVQYTRYEWQCPENVPREDAKEGEGGAKKQSEGDQPPDENGKEGDKGEKKKRRKKKVEEGEEEGRAGSHSVMDSALGSVRDAQGGASSVAMSSSQRIKAKTEKGKVDRRASTSTSNHRLSVVGKVGGDAGTAVGEAPSEVVHQPNFLQVISFSMSSKVCEEKGWILEKEETEKEFEQRTVLEWARERLQQAMGLAKEQQQREKDVGRDRPLLLRYYGDAKREAMLKYTSKRGNSKPQSYSAGRIVAPRLPGQAALPPGSASQHKVITGLPDGTMNVFYPSGKLAIILSKAGFGRPGYYTIVYNDNTSHDMLAEFTPTGRGTCYHPNGMVRFLSTEKMGMQMDTEGAVIRKWEWPLPHLRMATPIFFHLNHNISFRCHNRTQMTLSFLCHKESAKIQVGQVLMAIDPVTQEDLGYLEMEENFQSNAAKESIRPPPIIKKPPKREPQRWKAKGTPILNPKAPKPNAFKEQVAEIVKNLVIEDRTEYGIPAEKELTVLARKTRIACEDWMDHYRMAVGMQLISTAAPSKRRKRGVQSAKAAPTQNLEEGVAEEEQVHKAQAAKARVPSAPAVTSHKKRPFSTVSSLSMGRSSRSTSTRATERRERVRVDVEDHRGVSKPGTPAKFSTISGHVAGSGDRSRSPASRIAMSTVSTDRKKPSPLTGCPIALRAEMLGDTIATCRCSRHRIPSINDLELERFLASEVPRSQLVVVCMTSSLLPDGLPCADMLLHLYERQNKNRTKPCYQSRSDPYRLFLYDVAVAAQYTSNDIPELFTRHNAVPGMFLIYANSRLLFCDHIFNGYGNARKDFEKQMLKSKRDATLGRILPPDFHFSPTYGRRGPRSAWGGEIGGARERRFSGFPRLHSSQGGSQQRSSSTSSLDQQSRSSSTVTSLEQITLLRPGTRHPESSAAEYMSLNLSFNGGMQVAS
ncbi:uncharacterized protein LOC110989186 [Acanthaster planci]|uniref:Uncharacterized protein LOC110989186 n=1 Tax=Acanthaster planci TaxID=133434 RepID=A0A8B7ZVE2_ACAPL|nr:uncharacterized protein LOC110989186 [Acanthaster planci]